MKKVIFITIAIIYTQFIQAQSYSFDRIIKEQHYMAARAPISDTLINGSIDIKNGKLIIKQEGVKALVIDNFKMKNINVNGFVQPYTDGTHVCYFVDMKNQEFIVLNIGHRTTYKLKLES